MFNIEKAGSGTQPIHKAKERVSWPWKNMDVGDLVRIGEPELMAKAQVSCHLYARAACMKFTTRQIDGVLHVWRVS